MQIRGQKQLMWRAGVELAGGEGCAESALNSWRSSRRESKADSALYRPPLAEGTAGLRLLLSLQQATSLLPAPHCSQLTWCPKDSVQRCCMCVY